MNEIKYYPTKEEASEWSGGYHDIKYDIGKGYHLVVNKRAYNAYHKRLDNNIKRMQKDHRNEVRQDKRRGIINNHLCCGCDRIIGNGRQVCRACIDKGWRKIFDERENKEKLRKAY